MSSIKINKVTKIDKGNLRGFAEVEIDGIIIRDFRIIRPFNGKMWVATPSVSYVKDNQTKWYQLVVLPETLKKEVELAVLDVYSKNV